MPVDYTVHPDLSIVLVLFHGTVRTEENIEAFLNYRRHPDFDGLQNVLMDLAHCRFPDNFFAEMRALGDRMRPYYQTRDPRSRTSIYAPGNVAYGVSRLYRSRVNPDAPYPIGVFRTAEAALDFAGLDPHAPGLRGLLRPPPARGHIAR
ncbi:hypothetical protein [Sagittula stellata]|uniref:Uncharacterized protein n=1 Tax=Sagittula stellata (strain ATCC 700073 / DSM 11524 / E-37) TaxID=388399 RepID=A3KA70_SAGS3|nr:hypothetical protein [Sagittula stellata]EBA05861.1 hypothetical protein SSE37_15593 [Sagittula stellata E-37]